MDFRNIKIRGYWDGVWKNTNCKQWPNHAITLTGYTSSYWEIRNSWGSGWGNRGYLKITRSVQNVCQIASNAWYITAGSQEELE
jgi:C1A family cysteine protease